jgi:predicted hydrolase (HD superfamily)
LKDKAFAKGVSRDDVRKGTEEFGIPRIVSRQKMRGLAVIESEPPDRSGLFKR